MLFRLFRSFLALRFATGLLRQSEKNQGFFSIPNLLPEILMVRVAVRRSIRRSFRGTKTLTADFVDL